MSVNIIISVCAYACKHNLIVELISVIQHSIYQHHKLFILNCDLFKRIFECICQFVFGERYFSLFILIC